MPHIDTYTPSLCARNQNQRKFEPTKVNEKERKGFGRSFGRGGGGTPRKKTKREAKGDKKYLKYKERKKGQGIPSYVGF